MLPVDPQHVVDRLLEFQRAVRDLVVRSRGASQDLHAVTRTSSADTIYAIDAEVDPLLEDCCREWSRTTPLVLIAEGLEDEHGREGPRVFPAGTREADAKIRVIVDPIDGTRGIMYDKRPAWSLAAVAPNKGPGTRLRDCEVSVMTELPSSKMGSADVLWASKGGGARGSRVDLSSLDSVDLPLRPSQADTINHGFATVSNFFPGTKVLASAMMEHLVRHLIGPADVTRATVFDDQYISTGGQFYELIVGHDRFNADLRPAFYAAQRLGEGMCCHPYDCAGLLVAEEAGAVITDARGQALDAPLDTTTGVSWVGYANAGLRRRIEPHVLEYLERIEDRG
jgi:fructose-1,6-bisphosphatase/inositol monophosphatase family enzyme